MWVNNGNDLAYQSHLLNDIKNIESERVNEMEEGNKHSYESKLGDPDVQAGSMLKSWGDIVP